MIEYRPGTVSWLFACDRCGKIEHVATAKKEREARRVVQRWGWKLDTPNGDLCRDCVKVLALSEKRDVGHPVRASGADSEGGMWQVFLNDERGGEAGGRPRCEKCGRVLSWLATPRESGQYLCDECVQRGRGEA